MTRSVLPILSLLAACSPADPLLGNKPDVDTGGYTDTEVDADTDADADTDTDSDADTDTDTDTDTTPEDADGDGYSVDEDCDDSDASINPGADEVCDDEDNDCDGAVDNDPVDGLTWYMDADRDGYGTDDSAFLSCDQRNGAVSVAGDCDDSDSSISPGATEVCDGVDNDCNIASAEAGLVSFYSTRTGATSDVTADFESGSVSAPYAYSNTQSGRLSFCGGEWYASINNQADLTIRGLGGGASANTLSGARDTTVIVVDDDMVIDGVTITLGEVDSRTRSGQGGALYCDSGANLIIRDAVITDSEAVQGGGLYLDGCDTEIYDTEISDHFATQGAGIVVADGALYLEGVTISGNEAGSYGGALYLAGSYGGSSFTIDVDMIDTLVEDNIAGYYGAGMYAYAYNSPGGGRGSSIDVYCEQTRKSSQGGFLSNTHSYSTTYTAALYMMNYYGGVTFESVGCDFGASGASDDNSPRDITLYNAYPVSNYNFGNNESFTCDSSGCL